MDKLRKNEKRKYNSINNYCLSTVIYVETTKYVISTILKSGPQWPDHNLSGPQLYVPVVRTTMVRTTMAGPLVVRTTVVPYRGGTAS